MIRIERPREVPHILQKTGKRKTKENCDSYDWYPNDYSDGSRKIEFDRRVYAHRSVKQMLLNAQYKEVLLPRKRRSGGLLMERWSTFDQSAQYSKARTTR